MKQFVTGIVAAMAMGVMAETANTVEVTKFHQSYPYSGTATVEYTVVGALSANAVAEITLNTADASATFTQQNVVTGANTFTIDFASSFGGALQLTNASFVVTIVDGVQLWANGPYWAECNVGASNPEEDGYYFWWGDTVGYTNTGSGWISVKDGTSILFSDSGTAASTYGKDNSALQLTGYIDSAGNLVAAHDAATAHLGPPWRMPTGDEIDALASNCTTTWITTNGVNGRLVTGTGAYTNRSIFLPAAGYGYDSCFGHPGSYGNYWSSTPLSDGSNDAWGLYFSSSSSDFRRGHHAGRHIGRSVRPVRGFGSAVAVGIVTYDLAAPAISPEDGTTFVSSLTVSISCATEGATIYYTTDGSEPTKDSTAYRRFKIYGKTTVKAVAYDAANDLYSGVTTAEYALGTCANPMIAPSGGSAVAAEGGYVFYSDGQTVTIARSGEEGTIRYTLDGTDPTAESAAYSGAITLDATTTIKAKVFSDSYFDSDVVTVAFVRERTIGDAMGTPYHTFTTSGDGGKAFYRVADASAPNGEAMHSGDIGNSGVYGTFVRTDLSTTVTGPGTVSFSWKASCEDDAPEYEWDHGEFAVDGVVEAYISGETGWTNVSVAVTGSGEHTLTWTYLKDDAESEGEDCIWVAGYGWASAEAYTHTTVVPVPYAWLRAHDPGVVDEYEAYEASAQATAANGRKVWECYALDLDPQVATNDFRIASFPMKADGTPDWANVTFDPPQERWNVPDAPVVWKGAATPEGPWRTVTAEGGSPGTAYPTMRFFKAVVFGNVDVGVQLWEGGPYWATTNVGASEPWEYGFYFWWGDTVGYTRSGGTWTDYGDGSGYYSGVTWVSSTGEQMSSSPFDWTSCPTYKENAELLSAGYIDSTGNLAPEHDAAHVHWGGGWRMPTEAELSALISNCTTTWITTNGVYGRLVTGKGAYANKSIFLPAAGFGNAGFGNDSGLYFPGSLGDYWASTLGPDLPYGAWCLDFGSIGFDRCYCDGRFYGQSVRPVRGFAPTPTTMVTISFNASGGTVSPSLRSYAAYGTYNFLPTPTYVGYTFTGWYTEANGGTLVTSSSSVPASNTTLYAHWTANDPGAEDHVGVQLWEGGPYWATTNIGAEEPWEYGYYFWWGDTVGYTNTGSGWISVTDGTSILFTDSGTAASTYGKDNSALLSAGYIDATGNLAPEHDAAHAHWGGEWRMPTAEEIGALINNCTTTWITTNGVYGRLVTGIGAYANRSVFLPTAGEGVDSYFYYLGYAGSYGSYWSSSPFSGYSGSACYLNFNSSYFGQGGTDCFTGQSVRPVRGFAP